MHRPTAVRLSILVALLVSTSLSFSTASGASSIRRSSNLNPIQRENELPGTASWRLKVLSYHGEIQGYASSPSVEPGHGISFSVSTTGDSFVANVYRMGWYGGKGARLMMKVPKVSGHLRKTPKPNPKTGLILCHWPVSFSIHVPSSWLTGVYMVKLTASNTHQGYIPFVVTDPSSHTPYLFVHGVFTDEAYNNWGGKSLYVGVGKSSTQEYSNRAVNVAFHRPFVQNMGAGWFFSWEYHMVRWLEQRGYNVSYATDLDVDLHPGILTHHHSILIVGHDEYWTRQIRNGMDAAVAHGVNLANFAANTGFWQVRLQPYKNEPNAVIVCYKTNPDPIRFKEPWLTTTMWRSPPVNRPESELTGAMYGFFDGNTRDYAWVVQDPTNWIFKGTHLKKGSRIPNIVGQEADTLVPGFPHPKLHVLSNSPVIDATGLHGRAIATIYRTAHGSTVFDASTIDWSWGLDDVRQNFWLYPPIPKRPNQAAQTITSNILNKFGR